ncbi:UDP-3-O-acyl-N-acetylglucosamine deacetylase [Geoalkalibacter halelectricus]|uniref:UDP-3-O-acyl-N-acetylglucosamine deacetylase n=1 Tax=Geoalkalibacter halelectricus TaxID=2847045 RepID=A0ABY5ZSW4_9BACT|nr:UDP-3-O-acyl-N-acetylglucosamine deacetylase [Geoalkalibacter halelectricus]MDO3379202.1 UDP-3-O-acyl-N-acetylglucosamine deacetylase [Geoalkalibacter halelectricus]UWZ80960.1 UDP-3-O-acyl-N-acetylglucosamine deacetylase [Geoalkalibacter halelectricus]
MIFQSTIATPVIVSGIGLHSGRRITMNLRPAEAGTGILFHRSEGERQVTIEAVSANVIDTRLATVLGKGGLSVSTVEHLLAALNALGIDNLHIDIDGPEVPVLDGSAAPFVDLLHSAGVRQLERSRKFLAIRKPITLIEGEKRVTLIPSRFFRVSFDIAFDHPSITQQHYSFKCTAQSFRKEIAAARTFGFLHEVEYLKANGLARGGSLDNAIVIGEDGILNPEGLRYADEFVRHKILDSIGDFSLLGYPLLGHLKAYKAGHDINHKMVEKILAHPDHWKLVDFSEETVRQAGRGIFPAFAGELLPTKA